MFRITIRRQGTTGERMTLEETYDRMSDESARVQLHDALGEFLEVYDFVPGEVLVATVKRVG